MPDRSRRARRFLGITSGLSGVLTPFNSAGGVAPSALLPLQPASTTISHGGITYTLSQACQWCQTVDGQIGVITPPGGIQVLSRSPAQTTESAQIVNGTMKNPQRTADVTQGWDQRLGGYSAGLNASYPISIVPNDIIVGQNYHALPSATRGGVSDSWGVLHFISAPWPVNSASPAVIGWTGRGTPQAYQVDIDALVAALPSYDTSAMTRPDFATMLARFDRLEIGAAYTQSDGGSGYEYLTTWGAGNPGTNYGQYLNEAYSPMLLYLLSNDTTTANKKTILTRLIAQGIQYYDPCAGSGIPMRMGGAHWQFHHAMVLAALKYTGRSLASFMTHTPGDWDQVFLYDSGIISHLAPHTNNAYPGISHQRAITAVSGTTITVAASYPTYDTNWVGVRGLRLKRVSDGATAMVMTQSDKDASDGAITFVIDAQPGSPFAIGNTVYFESAETIRVGDPDWGVQTVTSGTDEHAVNPSFDQDYRALNFFADHVIFARAINAWHSSFDKVEQFVARSIRSNDPSASNDWPTHCNSTFSSQFWAAYGPTILGQAPVFLTSLTIAGQTSIGEVLTASGGTVAGAATITSTYQWALDGVDVSGATSSTYTVQSGDLGKVVTVRKTATNSYGSQTIYSQPSAAIDSGYVPNGVVFDGSTTWLYETGIAAGGNSKKMLVSFTVYPITTNYVFNITTAGGSQRIYGQLNINGQLYFEVKNSAGTIIINGQSPIGSVPLNTATTVVLGFDTTSGTGSGSLVCYTRASGGSWVSRAMGGTWTTDGVADTVGRIGVCTTNGAGDGKCNIELWDLYIGFDYFDLTNATNRDKFLPTKSKGTDGSTPTGSQPWVYLSGATASWHTNKTSNGGLAKTGTLTTSAHTLS